MIKNKKLHQCFGLILAVAFFSSPVSTQAADDKNYGAILNLSGKQRMLTQKMSKEVLFAAVGENAAENLKNAQKTAALFDTTLAGLKDGNVEMGLPATESARILRQLKKVSTLWTPFKATIDGVASKGTVEAADIETIEKLNLPLLKEMNKAVKLYEKEASASGSGVSGEIAVTINLAGKQRMLTQKMTKEYLLIALKQNEADNKLNLMDTFSLFDRTLHGLSAGDEVLELITAHNTPEINAQLSQVSTQWTEFKPLVEAAAAKGAAVITPDTIHTIATQNIPLLKAMNKAVGMYQAVSSQ